MKKLFLGLMLSLLTFLIGYIFVSQFQGPLVVDERQEKPVEQTLQREPIASSLPSTDQSFDFEPEFRRLPNFGDIEYTESDTDLVDVFETESIYRKSEVIVKPGETWLGLFEHDGQFSIESTKPMVRPAPPGQGYEDENSVRLAFNQNRIPIFILRGSKSLKPGTVASLYHRPSSDEISKRNLPIKSMTIGYKEHFFLNNSEYILRVAPGMTLDGTEANVLILETGATSQIVTYNRHFEDKNTKYDDIGNLLWVGDLDGDGKLDLYFSDFDYEKGGFGSNLFLSSEAKNEKLVEQVASFGTMGC